MQSDSCEIKNISGCEEEIHRVKVNRLSLMVDSFPNQGKWQVTSSELVPDSPLKHLEECFEGVGGEQPKSSIPFSIFYFCSSCFLVISSTSALAHYQYYLQILLYIFSICLSKVSRVYDPSRAVVIIWMSVREIFWSILWKNVREGSMVSWIMIILVLFWR